MDVTSAHALRISAAAERYTVTDRLRWDTSVDSVEISDVVLTAIPLCDNPDRPCCPSQSAVDCCECDRGPTGAIAVWPAILTRRQREPRPLAAYEGELAANPSGIEELQHGRDERPGPVLHGAVRAAVETPN